MREVPGTGRRRFLRTVGAAGAWCVAAALSACGGRGNEGGAQRTAEAGSASGADPCNDLSGLTPEQLEFRQNAEYVAVSTTPGQDCDDCKYWKPPRGDAPCGGCTAVAGPIHAHGHCALWEESEEEEAAEQSS